MIITTNQEANYLIAKECGKYLKRHLVFMGYLGNIKV